MLRFNPFRRFRPNQLKEAGVPTVPSNIKKSSSTTSVANTTKQQSTAATTSSSSAASAATELSSADKNVSVSSDPSKRRKKKTTARLRPRFENLQYMLASALVALATIGLQHYVRKGWDRFKGNRVERDLMAALSEKLEVRQDWSVALLYSAVRQANRKMNHALNVANSVTAEGKSEDKIQTSQGEKFGAPFLADPQFEEQIDFLDGFLTKLRNESFPTISMPDMWVAATLTALRSLGGPSLNITFGRGSSTQDDNLYNASQKTYHLAPPLLDQINCIDFAEEYITNGFSTPEIVALQGVRSLACHGDSNPQQMARLVSTVEQREKSRAPVALPDAPEKVWGSTSCGVLNFFFFQNLLEGQWEEKTKTVERWVPKSGVKISSSLSSSDSSPSWSNLFGLLGSNNKNNDKTKQSSSSSSTAKTPQTVSPTNLSINDFEKKKVVVTYFEDASTPNLCMEPRDLELLEDAYFAGWVHKFGQNEAEFLRVFGESMVKTTQLGWRDTIFNEVPWW